MKRTLQIKRCNIRPALKSKQLTQYGYNVVTTLRPVHPYILFTIRPFDPSKIVFTRDYSPAPAKPSQNKTVIMGFAYVTNGMLRNHYCCVEN